LLYQKGRLKSTWESLTEKISRLVFSVTSLPVTHNAQAL